MNHFVTTSLDTHLFFARIMKEHALFLEAGFPCKETEFINKAKWFREQFEEALEAAVALSDGAVSQEVLQSGEVFTQFTEKAECQTSKLTGVPINVRITQAEKKLQAARTCNFNREFIFRVRQLNQKIINLLNGFIDFKERILRDVNCCKLFTVNYPLLIEHILREAKLYRQILSQLGCRGRMSSEDMKATEMFWNQIMMEHAQFIRGLLDPTECELMTMADDFAEDYCSLLKEAQNRDCCGEKEARNQRCCGQEEMRNQRCCRQEEMRNQGCCVQEEMRSQRCCGQEEMRNQRCNLQETIHNEGRWDQEEEAIDALALTKKYVEFKSAGAEGITDCKIRSIILPLLADHVLREANHYLRILESPME